MELTQIRYFLTVARLQNLRRASEVLRVSPPALSKSIRAMESHVGYPLFERVGRQIMINSRGVLLQERLQPLFEQVESVLKDESGPAPVDQIRIGGFEVFSTHFLKILDDLPWKGVRLSLHELGPGELEKAIRERQIDFGITYLPIPDPELDHLKISSIEMGVYKRAGSFVGAKQSDLPFVVPIHPISGSPTRVRGLDGWPDDAYPRKVSYRVTLLESAFELVRQGRAVGYFPRFLAELHNAKVRPEFKMERHPSIYGSRTCVTEVFLVKRRAEEESPQMKQFARGVRKLTASSSPRSASPARSSP